MSQPQDPPHGQGAQWMRSNQSVRKPGTSQESPPSRPETEARDDEPQATSSQPAETMSACRHTSPRYAGARATTPLRLPQSARALPRNPRTVGIAIDEKK